MTALQKQICLKAASILKRKRLCKGRCAENADGNYVDINDQGVIAYCMAGAAMKAYTLLTGNRINCSTLDFLHNQVPGGIIGHWNDHPKRTKKEVIEKLKQVAAE